MRDRTSIARVKLLHPAIREEVPSIIDEAERKFPRTIAVRVVQGLRTFEEQDKLYQLGRTVKNVDGFHAVKKPLGNRVTNAKPGSSYHQYGLALDFVILLDRDSNGTYEEVSWSTVRDGDVDGVADWEEIALVFMLHGYEWGGQWRTFVDLPHVQKRFGYTWRDLYLKYANGDFLPGTKYVNLGSVS